MVEAGPAVALLFDEPSLGEQLRSALQERGARIVHEGPLAGLSSELLSSVDADVLVVNLDDDNDEALDRLYEALDGDRPRVVFNDGQASRRLEGWDRARWARHLAMKVLAIGDADPPRPPAPAEPAVVAAPAAALEVPVAAPIAPPEPEATEEAREAAASETLAAELEALLAAEPAEPVETLETGLNYAAGDGMPLHDGDFEPFAVDGDAIVAPDNAVADALADAAEDTVGAAMAPLPAELSLDVAEETGHDDAQEPAFAVRAAGPVEASDEGIGIAAAAVIEPSEHASFQLDHLELAPIGDAFNAEPVAAGPSSSAAATTSHASDNWSLVDADAPATPAVEAERAHPAEFGIHKLSAADYLAPDVDDSGESPIHPGMSLELVSLEEAIAPQHFESSHEMVLDLPSSVLPRLVVLGATTESTASVGEFLAALPADLRVTVLHTQHLAGRPADGLVDYFAAQCALPVRLAEAGMRAHVGEVIVVPSDRQVTLRRDGAVELQAVEADAAHVPSIDISFTQAASTFGRDVVAIVFAGRSTDAVAGCQAVHDRGGQIWVEAAGSEQAADMVSGVLAERLSHHAGTPRQLAARLAEQFSEGQP